MTCPTCKSEMLGLTTDLSWCELCGTMLNGICVDVPIYHKRLKDALNHDEEEQAEMRMNLDELFEEGLP